MAEGQINQKEYDEVKAVIDENAYMLTSTGFNPVFNDKDIAPIEFLQSLEFFKFIPEEDLQKMMESSKEKIYEKNYQMGKVLWK